MCLAEVMSKVRFHAAMRRHLLAVVLPEANRSTCATERAMAMRRLNYHSRVGYDACKEARGMMK